MGLNFTLNLTLNLNLHLNFKLGLKRKLHTIGRAFVLRVVCACCVVCGVCIVCAVRVVCCVSRACCVRVCVARSARSKFITPKLRSRPFLGPRPWAGSERNVGVINFDRAERAMQTPQTLLHLNFSLNLTST